MGSQVAAMFEVRGTRCTRRHASPIPFSSFPFSLHPSTLIKKNIKFFSYIRKFRMEQLQSHIWLTASSYMGKYLLISSYIRKPFLIYDFATAPLWISIYMRKILFSFLSVYLVLHRLAVKDLGLSLVPHSFTLGLASCGSNSPCELELDEGEEQITPIAEKEWLDFYSFCSMIRTTIYTQ